MIELTVRHHLQVQDLVDFAINESQRLADAVCSDEYKFPYIGGDFFEILKPTKDPTGPEDFWENVYKKILYF